MANDNLKALIEACEKEPVHIPGTIQHFGAMLVFDRDMTELLMTSQNAAEFLKLDNPNASAVTAALPKKVLQKLRKTLISQQQTLLAHGGLHYTAYISDSYAVVEIERIENEKHFDAVCTMAGAFERLQKCTERKELLDTLTKIIQELSDNERVLIYRFDEHWNGKVIAESVRPRYTSMLGQHFPASDIPAQVRKLYEENPIRVIADVTKNAIPVVTTKGAKARDPVNMSQGILRGVSPVHLQYLENMGVTASTSVAIYREGNLWGLIACHHYDAVQPDPIRRQAALRITEFASQRLWLLESYAIQDYQRKVHIITDELTQSVEEMLKPHQVVDEFGQSWLDLLFSQGCIYVRNSQYVDTGLVPEQPVLKDLLTWLNENTRHLTYWNSSHLSNDLQGGWPENSEIAGLLAIPLKIDVKANSWLLFFRKEQVEVRSWAGRPGKSDEKMKLPFGDVLSPRKSFERWEESVRGRSLAWQPAQIFAARDIAKDLIVVSDSIELSAVNERLNHLNDKLKYLAEYDDLTGIFNRRVTERHLQREFSSTERYKRPLCVLLMDLDNFKKLNDEFGHNAGDDVLKELCRTIQGVIRESDVFGRWGGEEFLIVAPETDLDAGKQLGERIRKAVEKMQVKNMPPITISIGVCQYDKDPTWDKMVDRADKAMYSAKQGGRNQVITA